MDKIIIDKNYLEYKIDVNNDAYILINSDVQTNKLELNIIDCKVKVIDNSSISSKFLNFINSDVKFVEIVKNSKDRNSFINNENSNLEFNIIDLYDSNVNYDVNETINSRNSVTDINIASVCYKNSIKNYKVYTENNVGDTTNKINCFGIVRDDSVLNYDVSSFIKQGAKKSVVRQSSNILLFDKESIGKNNPILLIEENDVKASHGSSIGKIDDDTMFYLCSRGLTKNEATHLICLGKLESLINKIDDEEIKESLINEFKERMS